MKIIACQFNDSYFPIMDGVGMTAHNYAYWIKKKFGESWLVAPSVRGYIDEVDYSVIRMLSVDVPGLKPYRIGLPWFDLSLKHKLAVKKFDILHAHCPLITGSLALTIAKRNKIPLVTTFHSKYKEDFKKTLHNPLIVNQMMEKIIRFYHQADYVWVPNRSTGLTLKEYGYQGNFEIMPNGTDLKIPDESQRLILRKTGREMIGAQLDEFVMLFVGQHRWEKNLKTTLKALQLINQQNIAFKMVFVGEGYALEEMKQMVVDYSLTDSVKFTGVITERQNLMHMYACADLFVFPSVYDNAPLVMVEASAFGIPSVVITGSSAAENIQDTVNGFCTENSPEDLADTVIQLRNNPDLIRNCGKEAQRTIYISWESIIELVSNRYSEIITEYRERKTG